MTEQDPAQPRPGVPDPSATQPPAAPASGDRSGWSQPPAPQSPGPPGAFTDRPPAPQAEPLPPGAGSPLVPGPPMSVREPIKDTTLNIGALVLFAGIAIVVIIVIAIVIALLHH